MANKVISEQDALRIGFLLEKREKFSAEIRAVDIEVNSICQLNGVEGTVRVITEKSSVKGAFALGTVVDPATGQPVQVQMPPSNKKK